MSFDELLESVDKKNPAPGNPAPNPNPAPTPNPTPAPAEEDLMPIGDAFKAYCEERNKPLGG